MTVSYAADVATVRGIPSCFVKLLKKWRGSIYKIIYFDLIVFLVGYYSLNMIYRYWLNEKQKTDFHEIVAYFHQYNSVIPLSFVLGFYVSIVVKRWSDQFKKLPWPDSTAVYVSTHIRGQDERGRKMRRTVMRYLNLSQIMVYIMVSPKAKKRFPTYDHLVDAGVLVENEKKILQAMDEIYPKQPKYWMPIVWASSILSRARKEGRIRDDYALRALNDSLNSFRELCITIIHYDTISIPLVYTQVVSLAVYSYFFAAVIGQQWTTETRKDGFLNRVDYYFPVFTTLEFFFYMGWLKVAESLICPFGEDDDDFDINYMIDRNLMISYLIVDEMHNRHPQLMKDQYWDEMPNELPGGGATPPEHSTARLGMQENQNSDVDLATKMDSQIRLLYKRPSASEHDSTTFQLTRDSSHIVLERDSPDTDESLKEEVWNVFNSTITPPSSNITLLADEEHTEDELTFEKLKEEREREKAERQQQKLQRTVENAAELAAEMPKKTRKRLSKDDGAPNDDDKRDETEDDKEKKPKNDETDDKNSKDADKDD